MEKTQIIWQPSGEYLKSRVAQFAAQQNIAAGDWCELIKKSTNDIEWFWRTFLKFADMQWSNPYDQLLDQSKGFPWTDWFIGGQTNIASNCLDWHTEPDPKINSTSQQTHQPPLSQNSSRQRRQKVGPNHLAIIWENESGQCQQLTYGELNLKAGKIAALLDKIGVQSGDAVGIYMPMVPDVVAILFGCFKIGAVAVPVFSGFGADALSKRMQDANAKVIFTADGGTRRGKLLEIKKDVDQIRDSVPSLKHVLVLKYCHNKINWFAEDQCYSVSSKNCQHTKVSDIWFNESIESLSPLSTNFDLAADHPSLYLYTSGTTGKPKGTIHTHAGAMAQIAKELGFVFDVQKSDRFFWLTDIGWMMGPWEMIGVTYWGGTLVLYDGAPDYPVADQLWQFVSKYKVSTLGVSPTAIRIIKAESDHLIANHDLSCLKYLGSTGEPWDYESYMWFFNKVGAGRCPVMNISGGTELIGCLLTPLPIMPLTACSLGSKGLAMDVDVYDEAGNSLIDSIGHLVLKQPAPSLTRGFLGDKQRYLDTYFSRFENIWYHGDWAKKTEDGYWYLYGRSDDTIKISGKRIGPGEIESVLIEHLSIKEAAAIGVPDETKGEALVCFVVLNRNVVGSVELEQEIQKHVATKCGAVTRPKSVYFIASLPKTRSGKIVRAAIRKEYLGETIIDKSSIENPESLQAISKVKA